MVKQTNPEERRLFYEQHQQGQTYEAIAQEHGVSKECVRYWCRRQRDGGSCQNRYQRQAGGILSRGDPKVRYVILRLRLSHPRWGPNRILHHLSRRASLKGCRLPSEASIGRYLHQWPRFRRQAKVQQSNPRPNEATEIHQRWQLDFKVQIALQDGTLVNLHTVRDQVGKAYIEARLFSAGRVGQRAQRVTLEQARSVLRHGFASWGTLPDEVQTDGETALVGRSGDTFFPSVFRLWLIGLGITPLRISHTTDNAEVERAHRTINDYAIVGNEAASIEQLQAILDQALVELNEQLPSRAEGCHHLPPVVAQPQLRQPRRPFSPEHELAHFDLKRIDHYLASLAWPRRVSSTGQVTIGQRRRYTIGRQFAAQTVLVRFDPEDRHFVFCTADEPHHELARRPARGLEVEDLTGLAPWPSGLGPQQLPLPFFEIEGVTF